MWRGYLSILFECSNGGPAVVAATASRNTVAAQALLVLFLKRHFNMDTAISASEVFFCCIFRPRSLRSGQQQS